MKLRKWKGKALPCHCKTSIFKGALALVVCWPSAVGMQDRLESFVSTVWLPWRKLNFLLQVVINCRLLLGWGQGQMSNYLISMTPSDTDPSKPCAGCLNLCEFVCESIQLIKEYLFAWWPQSPLVLTFFTSLLLRWFLDLWREGIFLLRLSVSKFLTLCIISGWRFLHLLLSALIMTEQWIDLKVLQNVIKIHFCFVFKAVVSCFPLDS